MCSCHPAVRALTRAVTRQSSRKFCHVPISPRACCTGATAALRFAARPHTQMSPWVTGGRPDRGRHRTRGGGAVCVWVCVCVCGFATVSVCVCACSPHVQIEGGTAREEAQLCLDVRSTHVLYS